MLPQSQSLARLQREQRLRMQWASPIKENHMIRQEQPDFKYNDQVTSFQNREIKYTSLPALPNIKKLNKIEITASIYKSRQPKLPSLSNAGGTSEQQLLRKKPMQDDVLRKSITPERRSNKRMSYVYAMRTKAGCQPNKATKINQDAAIVCPKNLENIGFRLFGVCDGHGLNGHIVSNQIKQGLPKHLQRLLKDGETIESAITKSFAITNREVWNSDVDTNLSGSTTVTVLMTKDRIYCGNVGDSRAIMGRYDNGWHIVELSRDHKPDDPQEKQKILEAGGRVECQKDFHGNPVGPMRVWLSYIQAPGLAMSRSMGDKVGAQAGVTADPEILNFPITNQDQFIIVASDGVWEYLSNEDVMSMVIPYVEKENPDQAAERVVAESIQAWRRNSLARDDITCIVVFLQK